MQVEVLNGKEGRTGKATGGAKRKNVLYAFAAHMKRFYWLYLFLIPGFIYIYLFKLRPIYGLQIAFKRNLGKPVDRPPWIWTFY